MRSPYELQSRQRTSSWMPGYQWTTVSNHETKERALLEQQRWEAGAKEDVEFRVIEVVPAPPPLEPKPTIEEKHAAELEKLAVDEKRWTTRAKRAATMLKKIRRRKRRLERQYAREEPT